MKKCTHNIRCCYRKPFLAVWLICCTAVTLYAQTESVRSPHFFVNQATLLGVGKAFVTDTYLSPLQYKGVAYAMLHERFNQTKLLDTKLNAQHQFHIKIATTKNPEKTASAYLATIAYGINGFYPLVATESFRMMGGGGWDFSLGGIYNVRNSNNPGSLKLSTNFNIGAIAFYNWRMLTFRWQLTTPFAGIYFGPEYGHSYYEIFSLGNDKGTVHFGSFHNQTALKNYITMDIPIYNFTFRIGYLGDYYRTHVNDIITRLYSHHVMIGLAMESLNFSTKKKSIGAGLKSSYY